MQAIPKFRSRFEKRFADDLTRLKLLWEYEPDKFSIMLAVHGGVCSGCGSKEVLVKRSYTPDFKIAGKFYIETKGKFSSKDRTKILAFKEQYPEVDFRLFFMRNNRIAKGSKVFYSTWCDRYEIKYTIGTLPKKWIKEFRMPR